MACGWQHDRVLFLRSFIHSDKERAQAMSTEHIEREIQRIIEAFGPVQTRTDHPAVIGAEDDRKRYEASIRPAPYGSQLLPVDWPAYATVTLENGRRFNVVDGADALEEYAPYKFCLAFWPSGNHERAKS
jgi:hypothetical protein